MKRCTKCRLDKPESEFGKHVRTPDGLRSHCKACGMKPPTPYHCRNCSTEWLRKGRGPVPRLCPDCEETLAWCSPCEAAYPHDMFHTGATTRTGHSNKCKACTRAYCRSDHGSQLRRSNALRRNYGLTLADYDEMVERQGGMCACCKRGLGVKPVVDHCHESGKVRGIVCYGCNTGLGKIGDNAEGAYRAEMYLWQTRDVLGELTSGRHTVAELIGVAA